MVVSFSVFDNIASEWHTKCYFYVEHIFANILKPRKYVQRENVYVHSMYLYVYNSIK